MKERPILFSTEMVNAIICGLKIMTRRVLNKNTFKLLDAAAKAGEITSYYIDEKKIDDRDIRYILSLCPYGEPGDRLWIKEKFRIERPFIGNIDYDFTNNIIYYYATDHEKYRDNDKWKSSRFMPRWASRINLEITNIRVERLHDITEEDARAEGANRINAGDLGMETYKSAFRRLWDSINLKRGYGWYTNPWVWSIEFRRIV